MRVRDVDREPVLELRLKSTTLQRERTVLEMEKQHRGELILQKLDEDAFSSEIRQACKAKIFCRGYAAPKSIGGGKKQRGREWQYQWRKSTRGGKGLRAMVGVNTLPEVGKKSENYKSTDGNRKRYFPKKSKSD